VVAWFSACSAGVYAFALLLQRVFVNLAAHVGVVACSRWCVGVLALLCRRVLTFSDVCRVMCSSHPKQQEREKNHKEALKKEGSVYNSAEDAYKSLWYSSCRASPLTASPLCWHASHCRPCLYSSRCIETLLYSRHGRQTAALPHACIA
jgi:hypothetical protein